MTPEQTDPGQPARLDRGTELALMRSYLAAERTLMAWLRTALSMISFGFTLVKLFEYLESSKGPAIGPLGHTWTPAAVGLSMMAIGVVSLTLAAFQHRSMVAELREDGLESKWSLALAVSSLVATLGVVAFASILMGA